MTPLIFHRKPSTGHLKRSSRFNREKVFIPGFTGSLKTSQSIISNGQRSDAWYFRMQKKVVGDSLYLSPLSRPDEVFEAHEMRDLLWKGLMSLKEDDREIIVMKEFQDMSYKDIAETLDMPIGSVMSRLFYARKKLAKLLEDLT